MKDDNDMDVTNQIKCIKCGSQAQETGRNMIGKAYKCPDCGSKFNNTKAFFNSRRAALIKSADLSGKGYRVSVDGEDFGELMSIWPAWRKGDKFFEQWNLGEDETDPDTNESLINRAIVVSGDDETSMYDGFDTINGNTIILKPGSFKENEKAPDSAQALLDIPINPEVKDIKSSYKSLILKRSRRK